MANFCQTITPPPQLEANVGPVCSRISEYQWLGGRKGTMGVVAVDMCYSPQNGLLRIVAVLPGTNTVVWYSCELLICVIHLLSDCSGFFFADFKFRCWLFVGIRLACISCFVCVFACFLLSGRFAKVLSGSVHRAAVAAKAQDFQHFFQKENCSGGFDSGDCSVSESLALL